MDCKGDRICDSGECIDPNGTKPSAPAPGVSGDTAAKLDSINSNIAAGYVGASGTLLFGIAATALEEEPATITGAIALLSIGVSLPIASGGGVKARRVGRAAGVKVPSLALPIVAWVAYGVTVAEGSALVAIGFTGGYVPKELIITTVATGFGATMAMSADAKFSRAAVLEGLNGDVALYQRPRRPLLRVSFAPIKGGGALSIGGSL